MRIIGVPLVNAAISSEFLEAIRGDGVFVSAAYINPRALETSNDYNCAASGFDRLIAEGYTFLHSSEFEMLQKHGDVPKKCVVCVNAWRNDDGTRKTPDQAAEIVFAYLKRVRLATSKDVAYIVQGSPKLYDSIVPLLESFETCEIVDTQSSADLAYGCVEDFCKLPRKTVTMALRERLSEGYANVIGCIGGTYRYDNPPPFTLDLVKAARVWLVRISDVPEVEQCTGLELLERIQRQDSTLNYKTAVIEIE